MLKRLAHVFSGSRTRPKAGERVVLVNDVALRDGILLKGTGGLVTGTHRFVPVPGEIVGWVLLDAQFKALDGGTVLPIWSRGTQDLVATWDDLRAVRAEGRDRARD